MINIEPDHIIYNVGGKNSFKIVEKTVRNNVVTYTIMQEMRSIWRKKKFKPVYYVKHTMEISIPHDFGDGKNYGNIIQYVDYDNQQEVNVKVGNVGGAYQVIKDLRSQHRFVSAGTRAYAEERLEVVKDSYKGIFRNERLNKILKI